MRQNRKTVIRVNRLIHKQLHKQFLITKASVLAFQSDGCVQNYHNHNALWQELFPVNAAVNFDLCYLLLIFHLRRFLANVWTMFYQLLWFPKRESSDHRQIRLFEQRNCKKAFLCLLILWQVHSEMNLLKMRPEKRKESELRKFRVKIIEINKFATHEFLIVFRGETLYTSLVTLNEVRRL